MMQSVTRVYNQYPRPQVYQLQQEKKKLQEDFSQLLKEREQLEERCTSYEHEKIQLGPRLEESKWEVSGATFSATHLVSSRYSDDVKASHTAFLTGLKLSISHIVLCTAQIIPRLLFKSSLRPRRFLHNIL